MSHQQLPVGSYALKSEQLVGCTSICHVVTGLLNGRFVVQMVALTLKFK